MLTVPTEWKWHNIILPAGWCLVKLCCRNAQNGKRNRWRGGRVYPHASEEELASCKLVPSQTAKRPTTQMDWQPFLTALLLPLRWDKARLHQLTVESSMEATCRLWTLVYFGTSPTRGSQHSSGCLDAEARNEGVNSGHQPPDPSSPALSAFLIVDLAMHKLPYPNNYWRPTPVTAQQAIIPQMD